MNCSGSVNELAAALAKAQAMMDPAKKGSLNPHFHSKYADLASVVEAVRKPFAENGLSYVQLPQTTETEEVVVETVLLHSSGQWISSLFSIPVARADAHGCMSALTYCRRGALAAIAGVAPEDDDGNAAVAAAPPTQAETSSPPRPVCPVCGKDAVIKGKAEYGGGWLCFGKKGGCGAKWPEGPFPTAAPPDAFDKLKALFPPEAQPGDAPILLGRIQGRFDKLGIKESQRKKMWAESCAGAAFMDGKTDVAALDDLLNRLGGNEHWTSK
jgi:hypothetical protein